MLPIENENNWHNCWQGSPQVIVSFRRKKGVKQCKMSKNTSTAAGKVKSSQGKRLTLGDMHNKFNLCPYKLLFSTKFSKFSYQWKKFSNKNKVSQCRFSFCLDQKPHNGLIWWPCGQLTTLLDNSLKGNFSTILTLDTA